MDSEIYNNWLIDWLKTQSDFHTPSNLKPKKIILSRLWWESINYMYFFNIHEAFTAKQANYMGNFAEILAENQSKNINIISI